VNNTVTNGLCALADVKAALNITDTISDAAIAAAVNAASRLIESKCNRRFWQDPAPRSDSGCTLVEGSDTVLDAAIVATDVGRSVIDPTGDGLVSPLSVVANVVPGVSFTLANVVNQDPQPALGSEVQALTISLAPRRYVSNDPWLVEVDDMATLAGLIVQVDYAGDGTYGLNWEPLDYQLEPINALMQSEPWPFTQIRAIRDLYFPVWGGIAYPKPYTQALVMVTAQWGWPNIPATVVEAAILQSIAIYRAKDVPFGATAFGETGIVRLKQALHPTAELLLSNWIEDPVLVA
jgi:hypothetical protein